MNIIRCAFCAAALYVERQGRTALDEHVCGQCLLPTCDECQSSHPCYPYQHEDKSGLERALEAIERARG